MKTLRARAGTAYAAGWQRASAGLERVAPRSARAARAVPRLPANPLSRRFGLDRGRPIDRCYIERFLARHGADVRGRVLEIYESTYSERFGGERVERCDVLDVDSDAPRATLRGDLATGEGIPAGAFDCFILTQTLGLVYDIAAAVEHAYAALAPGGVVLASVPGISHQSQAGTEEFPDHWRFTKLSAERLFAERFGERNVTVEARGNVATSAAFLYGLAEHELDAALFDRDDPDYELVICVRAVRGASR